MPEYLAPGVFVEETSFRSKSIEGVSTSTTAFVGLSRRGPAASVQNPPELLTSFADFERMYGGMGSLSLNGASLPNYMAHSVRAYFEEGGARLFFARVQLTGATSAASDDLRGARAESPDIVAGQRSRFLARIRGLRGNGSATFSEVSTPVPASAATDLTLPVGTMLRHATAAVPPVVTIVRKGPAGWLTDADAAFVLDNAANWNVLTLRLSLTDNDGTRSVFDNLAYDRAHPRAISSVLGEAVAEQAGAFAWFDLANAVRGHALRTAILALPAGTGAGEFVRTLQGGTSLPARFRARSPGSGGNGEIHFTESHTPVNPSTLAQLPVGTMVMATTGNVDSLFVRGAGNWIDSTGNVSPAPAGNELHKVTVNLTTFDADGYGISYDSLNYSSEHASSLARVLPQTPPTRDQELSQLYWFEVGGAVSAFQIRDGIRELPRDPDTRANVLRLQGGVDGQPGGIDAWENAFDCVAAIDDVSILASPGATELPAPLNDAVPLTLRSEAEQRRSYRIAVLDVPRSQTPSQAAQYKDAIDSKYAALYYPWVVVPNPEFNPNNPDSPTELVMPPSGFVSGIYARSDIERGVWKAPANEVVRSALRFERQVLTGEQEMLNPAGVNCLRYFAGRGHRVWGARTTSSDPEWKYVNIRRYFNYLERSIDRGTQWAVFEPNGERLWANVKETITSFLYNEWVSGALLGTAPEQAFFVRCDRSTITQNDLDNGRLICLIGVAAIKPAEFVIFRIGQKTADSK